LHHESMPEPSSCEGRVGCQALEDTLWLGRAHSLGHSRQLLNLLGYAVMVNYTVFAGAGGPGISAEEGPLA
jgi:hypothetical protein